MTKLLRSSVFTFFLGILAFLALKVVAYWILFLLDPTPIQAKGWKKEFREITEINPQGRVYFYSLEFPGKLDEFHAYAKRLKFPGSLASPTKYLYTTPDHDQQISISHSDGTIRYQVE